MVLTLLFGKKAADDIKALHYQNQTWTHKSLSTGTVYIISVWYFNVKT